MELDTTRDNRMLLSVAALVTVGAVGVALLACRQDDPATSAAASTAPRTTAEVPAPPALPATYTPGVGETVTAPTPFTPGPDENFVARGLESWSAREYERATAYFAAEVDRRPERPWSQYMLGLSLWKAGDADGAVAALERSASLDPSSIKTWINLSRVHNDRGTHDAALEAAQRALAVAPDDAEALFLEGRSLRNLARLAEAEVSLSQSVALDGTNGYAWNLLGLVRLDSGGAEEALVALERAAAEEPDVTYIENNLGMALERSGRRVDALAAYRRAVALDPSHARAAANLARLAPVVAAEPVEGTIAVAEAGSPVAEDDLTP